MAAATVATASPASAGSKPWYKILYVQVLIAIVLGALVGWLWPGYAKQAEAQKSVDFVLHIIPDTVVGAFAQGEILQVLLFSVLFGFAIMGLGERGHTIRSFIDDAAHAVFGVISIVMRAAPIGAFGAMAYTIGKFGTGAILNLMGLIATFYLTAALFVFVVLGIIPKMVGFSIFQFLAYLKD